MGNYSWLNKCCRWAIRPRTALWTFPPQHAIFNKMYLSHSVDLTYAYITSRNMHACCASHNTSTSRGYGQWAETVEKGSKVMSANDDQPESMVRCTSTFARAPHAVIALVESTPMPNTTHDRWWFSERSVHFDNSVSPLDDRSATRFRNSLRAKIISHTPERKNEVHFSRFELSLRWRPTQSMIRLQSQRLVCARCALCIHKSSVQLRLPQSGLTVNHIPDAYYFSVSSETGNCVLQPPQKRHSLFREFSQQCNAKCVRNFHDSALFRRCLPETCAQISSQLFVAFSLRFLRVNLSVLCVRVFVFFVCALFVVVLCQRNEQGARPGGLKHMWNSVCVWVCCCDYRFWGVFTQL